MPGLTKLAKFWWFAACLLCAQAAAADRLALVGGTLVDGTLADPIRDSVVLVEGERITAVGTVATLPVPADATVISTEGMTVLPGLWDMHVHLMINGHADYEHWDKTYPAQFRDVIMPASARQLLLAGVTGARDLGAPLDDSIAVRDAINAGLALVPEDRKAEGLVIAMPVRANISLASLLRDRRLGLFRNAAAERRQAAEMIDKLNIKLPSAEQIVRFLSGGNQQKVVLGKWLSMSPRVLLLDEPTRGIDVGAKQEIYRLMESLAEAGVAVVFVSSELEEILGMADRVLVMYEGRITGELAREQLNEEAVMQLATGGRGAA